MSWFETVESYVIHAFRIILVAVGALAVLALAGVLIWLASTTLISSSVDPRKFLDEPSYEQLRSELLPTTVNATSDNPENKEISSQSTVAPYLDRLTVVTNTLDQQYNIAGREERKFSEMVSASYLGEILIEQGLSEGFDLKEVVDDYLDGLQAFATEISQDEVLSRIADTNSRTEIITNAINKFHAEYVVRLESAINIASAKSTQQAVSKALTLRLVLWSLGIGFAVFLLASMILLLFRIETHMRKRPDAREVSA